MGIFSRTRDIIAANVTDLLDKSQDPAKMIRMIILEMEETLVEVRASAARTIADQKELRRHIDKLNTLEADWTDKAHLALSKDREDLAKAALVEKRKATDMKDQLTAEVDVLNDALTHVDFIQVLDGKPVTIQVPMILTGNSRGVRNGGKLKFSLRNLKVKGLINDLPSSIEHDITELRIGQAIRVAEVKAGKPYKILNSDNAVVVSIAMSRNAVADADDDAGEEEAAPAEASAE
jgi:hypothetical protein